MATATLATIGGAQLAVGYPGQLAANANDSEIESRNNENATAVDYGDAVCRGAATTPGTIGNCRPPFNSGVVIGLAVRQLSEANTPNSAGSTPTVNYAQNKTVPILKDGWMWCLAAENVAEGDDALAVVGSSGLGSVQTGATSATRLAVPNCKWQQTVTSGNVGLVHIKAP